MKRLLYIKYMSRRLLEKIWNEKLHMPRKEMHDIVGYPVPSNEEANDIIRKYVLSDKPFCLLRPGNSEYSLATKWDEYLYFGSKRYKTHNMFQEIDSDMELAERWVNTFEKDMAEADIFACFSTTAHMEHYIIDKYAKPAHVILLPQIESIWLDDPWVQALEGKKVLFINPFAETMKKQYERRHLIWPEKCVLPDMDAKFLKSVWYLGKDDNSGFGNWFEALDYLYTEASKIDFDIAILSCGPFSTFLAAQFKRDGKQAIQYGGALQMLFGIRGARWDDSDEYKGYFNEYWVRPNQEDAPKGTERLDNKIYW